MPLGGRGTLLCSVNDTGVLHEKISQDGGALSLRAKSKQLKELSLSSEAHDANKDLLLSLVSTKTSLVSFFLPWFCVVVRLRVFVVVFVPSSEASLDRCRQYRSLGPRKTFLRSLIRL